MSATTGDLERASIEPRERRLANARAISRVPAAGNPPEQCLYDHGTGVTAPCLPDATDPDAGSLVGEIWGDLVPRDALPELEASYQSEIARMPALDHDAARQYLSALITRKTTELASRLERHQERAEAEELLTPHRMAFDDSREGRLLRRYEHACKEFFLRCLDEVRKHREERVERAKQGLGGPYYRPTSAWFVELAKGIPSETKARLAAIWNCDAGAQKPDGVEEVNAAAGNGAEINARVDVERAVERQECRSAAESTKSQIRNPKEAAEAGGAAGNGAEVSSPIDAVRSAERDERAAMEIFSLSEGSRGLETPRSRVIGDLACLGDAHATNGVTTSNKERKRRRREERKRIRELSVVSGPLSVG